MLLRYQTKFHAAFLRVEDLIAALGTTKCAVKCAFQLTANGLSLSRRLQNPSSGMDQREVHQIDKLGNYRRFCLSLANPSRSYHAVFTSLRSKSIEPFAASTAHRDSKARHAHAVFTNAVTLRDRGGLIRPRAIGVTKEDAFCAAP